MKELTMAGSSNEAHDGESTAMAFTMDKCRELSGCPAGVDLQDWVKMLVSELSVVEEIHNSAVFITDELYDASPKEVQGNIRSLACMKMPAYARLVAGIKADGVEEFAESQKEYVRQHRNEMDQMLRAAYAGSAVDAERFAKQLREGADK
ncbi:hypothetical protein [Klebsiella aerogenes]|uniref:hypothetical protein n=1 Tax=Klebsiella aerogenes TaxID=548 RepID=UPI000F4F175B|nr:hypothetical protein [Klebsiella aerogenes]AYY00656.1 hypothetical protein EGY11_11260 [Klebsiella aerogenes]DAO36796.1 MAG TPA: hypothetical protein [Caudoviricetes sp.]